MQNPIRYLLYICVKAWLNLLPPPSGRHGDHAARAHGSQADMVLRPLWRPSISGSPTYSDFVVILFARPPSAPFEEGLSSSVRSVRRPQWRPLESLTPAPAPAPGSEKNQSSITKYGQSGLLPPLRSTGNRGFPDVSVSDLLVLLGSTSVAAAASPSLSGITTADEERACCSRCL